MAVGRYDCQVYACAVHQNDYLPLLFRVVIAYSIPKRYICRRFWRFTQERCSSMQVSVAVESLVR
jgi:hypothetical protein